MTAWDASLPQKPEREGWKEVPQRNVAIFSPDVGPPKYRRRNTANGTVASVTYIMTDAQVATFLTFYQTTLVDGTLPFTWNHPISGVSYSWIFDEQPPEIQSNQYNWNTVTFQLRRLP